MEIWDAYHEDGTPAGVDLIRGEAIPDGLFHMVCEVLVRHSDGTYLLMQRDRRKPTYPGLFMASAGGSAIKGETPMEGATRELYEETGIAAPALQQIYYRLNPGRHTIYYGFFLLTDCNKSSIQLQEGETIAYLWLPQDDFLDLVETDAYIPSHRERIKSYLKMARYDSSCI